MSQKFCPLKVYYEKCTRFVGLSIYNTVAVKINCRHFSVNISASDAPKTVYN